MTGTAEKKWSRHKNSGEGMKMTQEQRRRNGHDTGIAGKKWS